ncbi:hypothetical protein [Fibrobacter sp.]|uniref:hypothetical protein n=1 Tax=Fibrobacter sp. TaxID=35828 RepID=UPI003890C378
MFVIASLKEAWRSVLEFCSFEHYKYKSKRNDWQGIREKLFKLLKNKENDASNEAPL